jgi:hypothetical protein
MTPFSAIYRKESREHGLSLLIVFYCICAILILPVLYFGAKIVFAFLLWQFYITATAAMSYAKEDESKTARFLRTLPLDGGTLLLAKLAWLGTAMFLLFLPILVTGCYAIFYLFDMPFHVFSSGGKIQYFAAVF